MPKTNDAALTAFIALKAEIDAMLERLAALSADHFECSPEDVNWGNVGTLEHYRPRLREITDMAFREGEHADCCRADSNPALRAAAPPRPCRRSWASVLQKDR